MNQILFDLKKNKKRFIFLFVLSFFIVIILSFFIILKFYFYSKNNNLSNILSYNYNTIKLYSNNNEEKEKEKEKEEKKGTKKTTNKNLYYNKFINIACEISIPSLDISYPVFCDFSYDNLKISPCIFYGDMPPEKGNLCIAGHNYDNGKFFSLIYKLKKGDKIYIYDNYNNEYCYLVFDNYEVKKDDLSPLDLSSNNKYELTLITCNNFNNNRVIVKANY